MINNITINGVVYNLIDNPDKNKLSCCNCELIDFCNQELSFTDICEHINQNNYYKTVKQ